MLESLKQEVCEANLALVREGLVIHTWGNASGLDRTQRLMVIKASGVPYSELSPEHMVVVSLEDGTVIEGNFKPSSDTATHLELYRAFAGIGGIAHTHSLHATAWAQARQSIPALGTTHADYFHGEVPCTRAMTREEIEADYELNTGRVIVERFRDLDALRHPAALVASHGPFAWGRDAAEAAHNATVLEFIAQLASATRAIAPGIGAMPRPLLDRHFLRKHGPTATYGQTKYK